MIRNKIRPNVLIAIGLAGLLSMMLLTGAYILGFFLIYPNLGTEGKIILDVAILVSMMTLAITVAASTIGGIIALGGQMATDPEPNALLEYLRLRETNAMEVEKVRALSMIDQSAE